MWEGSDGKMDVIGKLTHILATKFSRFIKIKDVRRWVTSPRMSRQSTQTDQ